jgi:hypothetical protein
MSDAWLGFWLIVAASFLMTFTLGAVAVGLAVVMNRMEEPRGGCRGGGCRRDAGRQGCTRSGAVEGPAASDFATLARAGWVDMETVRQMEGK